MPAIVSKSSIDARFIKSGEGEIGNRSAAANRDDDLEPVAIRQRRAGMQAFGTISPLRSTCQPLAGQPISSSRAATEPGPATGRASPLIVRKERIRSRRSHAASLPRPPGCPRPRRCVQLSPSPGVIIMVIPSFLLEPWFDSHRSPTSDSGRSLICKQKANLEGLAFCYLVGARSIRASSVKQGVNQVPDRT